MAISITQVFTSACHKGSDSQPRLTNVPIYQCCRSLRFLAIRWNFNLVIFGHRPLALMMLTNPSGLPFLASQMMRILLSVPRKRNFYCGINGSPMSTFKTFAASSSLPALHIRMQIQLENSAFRKSFPSVTQVLPRQLRCANVPLA